MILPACYIWYNVWEILLSKSSNGSITVLRHIPVQDIPKCVGITDDIVIFGYGASDHDTTLYLVLDRARDVGM